jgi:hypothetical protein
MPLDHLKEYVRNDYGLQATLFQELFTGKKEQKSRVSPASSTSYLAFCLANASSAI